MLYPGTMARSRADGEYSAYVARRVRAAPSEG